MTGGRPGRESVWGEAVGAGDARPPHEVAVGASHERRADHRQALGRFGVEAGRVEVEELQQPGELALEITDQVLVADQLLPEATELCRRLAALPTTAIALTKRMFDEASRLSLAEAMDREAQVQDEAAATNDHLEGVLAFLEKRAPTFTGT